MTNPESVTAAKQKAAAFDKAGVLTCIRDAFGMPDAVSDEMLAELIAKAMEGGGSEAPEMPGPEAEAKDAPPALPFELPAEAAEKKKKCEAEPRITLDASVEAATSSAKNARIIAAVQKAATLGTITPQTLDAAGKLASKDVESFERLFCEPPAPAAGQIINASAKDRSGRAATYADTVRAARNAAASVK